MAESFHKRKTKYRGITDELVASLKPGVDACARNTTIRRHMLEREAMDIYSDKLLRTHQQATLFQVLVKSGTKKQFSVRLPIDGSVKPSGRLGFANYGELRTCVARGFALHAYLWSEFHEQIRDPKVLHGLAEWYIRVTRGERWGLADCPMPVSQMMTRLRLQHSELRRRFVEPDLPDAVLSLEDQSGGLKCYDSNDGVVIEPYHTESR